MSSEHGDVYILQEDDDEWVSPTPAGTAIREAVADETDFSLDDVDDIEEYVEFDDLQAVLDGDEDDLTFSVEGHDVTVDSDGNIDVES